MKKLSKFEKENIRAFIIAAIIIMYIGIVTAAEIGDDEVKGVVIERPGHSGGGGTGTSNFSNISKYWQGYTFNGEQPVYDIAEGTNGFYVNSTTGLQFKIRPFNDQFGESYGIEIANRTGLPIPLWMPVTQMGENPLTFGSPQSAMTKWIDGGLEDNPYWLLTTGDMNARNRSSIVIAPENKLYFGYATGDVYDYNQEFIIRGIFDMINNTLNLNQTNLTIKCIKYLDGTSSCSASSGSDNYVNNGKTPQQIWGRNQTDLETLNEADLMYFGTITAFSPIGLRYYNDTKRVGWTNIDNELLNITQECYAFKDGSIQCTASSGSSSIQTNNTLYVSKNGNDGTALPNRLDKPYLNPQTAVLNMGAGDTIVIFQGIYNITGSMTITQGGSIIGIGNPTLIGANLSNPMIITRNDNITIKDLKILSNTAGIGVWSQTPIRARGLLIRGVNIQDGGDLSSAISIRDNRTAANAKHNIQADIYDSILHSGSSFDNTFGITAYTNASTLIRLFDLDVYGVTDGVGIGGDGSFEVYGGTYRSDLDAITASGNANAYVVGAKARGDQSDLFNDGTGTYIVSNVDTAGVISESGIITENNFVLGNQYLLKGGNISTSYICNSATAQCYSFNDLVHQDVNSSRVAWRNETNNFTQTQLFNNGGDLNKMVRIRNYSVASSNSWDIYTGDDYGIGSVGLHIEPSFAGGQYLFLGSPSHTIYGLVTTGVNNWYDVPAVMLQLAASNPSGYCQGRTCSAVGNPTGDFVIYKSNANFITTQHMSDGTSQPFDFKVWYNTSSYAGGWDNKGAMYNFDTQGVANTFPNNISHSIWKVAGTTIANLTNDGTYLVKNITVDNIVKLKVSTIGACNADTNGSIQRNNSGTYGCNYTGSWVRIF